MNTTTKPSRMRTHKKAVLSLVIAQAALGFQAVYADDQPQELEEVVVTAAGRLPTKITSLPHSVTILSRDDIQDQAAVSVDLGQMLSMQIPGMSLSSQSAYNKSASLRGRRPAVLIDGILIGTPLRDGSRALRTISPAAIGGVNVIRGASAVYGNGGGGGVINFTTKNPGNENETSVEVGMSSSVKELGDETSYNISLDTSGREDSFYYLATGFYEDNALFHDADGDLIAPDPFSGGGIADSKNYNILIKAGFDVSDSQQLELTAITYKAKQGIGYGQGESYRPGITDLAEIKSSAVTKSEGELGTANDPRATNVYTKNDVAIVKYVDEEFFGNSLTLQGTYQSVENVYGWFNGFEPIEAGSSDVNLDVPGGQSMIQSEKYGARLDIVTDFDIADGARLLWGMDYTQDTTGQVLTNAKKFTPEMTLDSIAAFAQFEVELSEQFVIRGGARYESAELEVPDYNSLLLILDVDAYLALPLDQHADIATLKAAGVSLIAPAFIKGGSVDYKEMLFNFGGVFHVSDNMDIFGGYSQGFSISDVGKALRVPSSTVNNVNDFNLEPQIVDNYELGLRANYESTSLTAAVFYNSSELGTDFNPVTLAVSRAPEDIWGLEFTADSDISDSVRIGGTLAWIDGETEVNNTTVSLGTIRIPPVKATAYVDWNYTQDWTVRLQALIAGSQDRFSDIPVNEQGEGQRKVNGVTTFDLLVTGDVGSGKLSIGVQNLFNEDYYVPYGQMITRYDRTSFTHAKGVGTRATIRYRYNF